LTGYVATDSERLICLVVGRDGDPAIAVPDLEYGAALAAGLGRDGAVPVHVATWAETDDPFTAVADLLRARVAQPQAVAVADRMWAMHVLGLRDALAAGPLQRAGPVLRELRMRKDRAEITALHRAAEAIDRVQQRVPAWLRPGRTEVAVANDIHDAILAEGHATVDFITVGSGPNSAIPHHTASDRGIESGDPVVIDIGGTTPAGYCSDTTRTYLAGGQPDDDFRRLYDVLRRAQDAACEAVRPGVTGEALDDVARRIITDAGYGEMFIHRTGHGIGLETHEEPYIVAGNSEPLEPGMVFSVEPGIYLAGRYGARIEDIVVCVESGGERLNHTDRGLAIVPA
ncbi:MAG: M24 family metallopeptidase, partial [Mycobacteriales bacterium]